MTEKRRRRLQEGHPAPRHACGKTGSEEEESMTRKRLITAALAALLILGIVFPGAAEINKSSLSIVDAQELTPAYAADDVYNVLLLGNEYEDGTSGQGKPSASGSKAAKARDQGLPEIMAYHTDAVMVLSVNKTKGKINLISIPRDTMVYVPGVYGVYKLNDAFNCASSVREGISRTRDTVRWLLGGVKIDAYVFVDMGALTKLATVLGGVDFDLEVSYTGTSGRGYSAGRQHLDGIGVMDYVRARKNIDSNDQNRTERGRKMISAIIQKLWGNWDLVNTLWETANGSNINFYTNIEGGDLTALYQAVQGLSSREIGSYVLSGDYGTHTTCGDFQFRILDQDNRIRVLKEVFGIEAAPLPYISQRYVRWLFRGNGNVTEAADITQNRYANDGFDYVKHLRKGQFVMDFVGNVASPTPAQKAALADFEMIYNDFLEAFENASAKVEDGDYRAVIPTTLRKNYERSLQALADAFGYTESLNCTHGHFWEQDYAINQYHQIDWR